MGEGRPVTDEDASVFGLSVSADGKAIFYSEARPGRRSTRGVRTVLDTGETTVLVEDATPVPAPSGNGAAYRLFRMPDTEPVSAMEFALAWRDSSGREAAAVAVGSEGPQPKRRAARRSGRAGELDAAGAHRAGGAGRVADWFGDRRGATTGTPRVRGQAVQARPLFPGRPVGQLRGVGPGRARNSRSSGLQALPGPGLRHGPAWRLTMRGLTSRAGRPMAARCTSCHAAPAGDSSCGAWRSIPISACLPVLPFRSRTSTRRSGTSIRGAGRVSRASPRAGWSCRCARSGQHLAPVERRYRVRL